MFNMFDEFDEKVSIVEMYFKWEMILSVLIYMSSLLKGSETMCERATGGAERPSDSNASEG